MTEHEEKDEAAAVPAVRHVEVEPLPSYVAEGLDIDYKKMLAKFKERARFVEGVRAEALSSTKPHHWIGRKDRADKVTMNLMSPGAERIRTLCGIGFQKVRTREETWTKESGHGYTIYFEAEVYLGHPAAGTLPVVGSCSSDDDFFSVEHARLPYNPDNPEHAAYLESGEGSLSKDRKTLHVRRRIPSSEVAKENILKAALANLTVNGVTRILGIRNLTEKELSEYGIKVADVQTIEYASGRKEGGKLSPAEEQKRRELWDMLLEMNGSDDAAAAKQMKALTAFSDYAGCDDPQRLTAKQVGILHPKVRSLYEKHRGNPEAERKPAKGKEGQRELL